MIVKILAENGYCTVNEIIDKDGLSQETKDMKRRHDVYDRVIKGSNGLDGLIAKWIVEPEDKQNWKTKRKNRYRLTLFGMLYTIYLFSNDDYSVVNLKYNDKIEYKVDSKIKYKKKILDVLVENYSDMLPLIFKRWDFLVSEFGTLVTFLITIARLSDNTKKFLVSDPLISSEVVHTPGWKITDLSFHSELSILVFTYFARQEVHYKEKFEKDVELLKIYKEYIKFLRKINHIDMLRINYHEALFNGNTDKAKKIGVEFIETQGLDSDKWLENFDKYPEQR